MEEVLDAARDRRAHSFECLSAAATSGSKCMNPADNWVVLTRDEDPEFFSTDPDPDPAQLKKKIRIRLRLRLRIRPEIEMKKKIFLYFR